MIESYPTSHSTFGQNVFAKKVNHRPVDSAVSLIHDPRFGIIFTNGEGWRTQRKTFVSILRQTGFQKSSLESAIRQASPLWATEVAYTHFDEHGTVTMGRYQDPRASMGHLISNFLPDGTLSAFTFSLFCCSKINLLIVYHFGFGQPKKV